MGEIPQLFYFLTADDTATKTTHYDEWLRMIL